MSLQFVIDGYNIINHPEFSRACKTSHNPQPCLIDLIRAKRLSGSLRNPVTVVFDGYPVPIQGSGDIKVVFSRDASADENIEEMVAASASRGSIVVVTDDSGIRGAVKSLGARVMSVAEFVTPRKRTKPGSRGKDQDDTPGYSERQRIDEELRNLWLK